MQKKKKEKEKYIKSPGKKTFLSMSCDCPAVLML
jgi:hypothetical protein